MALWHLVLVALLVGQAAGVKDCTDNSDCTAPAFTGVCSEGKCACSLTYRPDGNNCIKSGQICADDTDCDASKAELTGTCTSLRCACAAGFGPAEQTCKAKPGKPTLSISGGSNDLSRGASYTLTCTLVGSDAGTSFLFYKDGAATSSMLTDVTSSSIDGDYTCTAVKDRVESDPSDALTIAVGDAGKRCSVAGDCVGDQFAGTCGGNSRCDCETSDTFIASQEDCKLRPDQPTISLPSGAVATDLSMGGTYTLTCTPDKVRSTNVFNFYKGATRLESGTLTNVSSSTDGDYTCRTFVSGGLESVDSSTLTITVGAAGKRCTANGDCPSSNVAYEGTCTSNRCVCGADAVASGTNCLRQLAKPTLKIWDAANNDVTATANDLSAGADYTLVCNSTNAPSAVAYLFIRQASNGQTTVTTGQLTGALATRDDGSHACSAVTTDASFLPVPSDVSLPVVVKVNNAGKRCTSASDCTGTEFTGTCDSTTSRCACASNYKPLKTGCGNGGAIPTASLFGILLTLLTVKLL